MCIAMCLGGTALLAAFFAAARLVGYPDVPKDVPALAVMTVALLYALPMAAWMRFPRDAVATDLGDVWGDDRCCGRADRPDLGWRHVGQQSE
jgi:hypothetical protein